VIYAALNEQNLKIQISLRAANFVSLALETITLKQGEVWKIRNAWINRLKVRMHALNR
tara:strand:- start:127287 stop:127460 length:174 start_codon:yes stop_codon:yes gene_type:complete